MSPPSAMTLYDDNGSVGSMTSDEMDAEWESDDWIKVPDSVGGSVPHLIQFMRERKLMN
jgi:hypothetical protein